MDSIGLDLHKRESQRCILPEAASLLSATCGRNSPCVTL